ncbi:pimeloyl-ACP methyl ester carboxylesterase [Nocardiopsis mwathae]|uniref:Pimeloyl-ACP methyl ester carboxylesterase n=1 Tax=Nocardiopsis mwathae TaxID=1472723 RepID=A0A7W9YQ25_9ACTN|nr:alpha/beta fold hydrolase [Nocardiopsis mwathae]MBB6175166.1 pimeloyl-ACP methyl ester carboxylesterase [Nocardiopsis mwathae]
MYATLTGDVTLRYVNVDPGAGAGSGDRPPVLLVHGFGSSYEMNWERTGWPTALTGAGLRFIGPDLRGHGGSDKPHDPDAYLPEVFAADMERLLDTLGLPRVDIVSYSMGSRLAWEFALTRPERVRRAVLGGFGPRNAFEGTDLDSLETDTSRFGDVFRTVAALPGTDAAALAACVRGQAARPFTPDPAPAGPALLFVAGENDVMAEGVEDLAGRSGAAGVVRVPRRDHANAVSARAFKTAAVEFLIREAAAGPTA